MADTTDSEVTMIWQFSLTMGPAGFKLWVDGRPAYDCTGYMGALIKMQELIAGLMRDTLHPGDVVVEPTWGAQPELPGDSTVHHITDFTQYETGEPIVVREGAALRTAHELVVQLVEDVGNLLGVEVAEDAALLGLEDEFTSDREQQAILHMEALLGKHGLTIDWDDGYCIFKEGEDEDPND